MGSRNVACSFQSDSDLWCVQETTLHFTISYILIDFFYSAHSSFGSGLELFFRAFVCLFTVFIELCPSESSVKLTAKTFFLRVPTCCSFRHFGIVCVRITDSELLLPDLMLFLYVE